MTDQTRRLSFVALFALATMTGCSYEANFQVLDAKTQAPIEDVAVEHRAVFQDIFFGEKNHSTKVSPTDAQGMTQAAGLHGTTPHRFQFGKDGYRPVVVTSTSLKQDPTLRVFENDGAPIADQAEAKFKEFRLPQTVIVELHRQ